MIGAIGRVDHVESIGEGQRTNNNDNKDTIMVI